MRLPLLVSASPSVQKTPVILLREGVWKAEGTVINSEVLVMFIFGESGECKTIGLGEEIKVDSTSRAKAIIQKPGTEKSISIDVVRIKD